MSVDIGTIVQIGEAAAPYVVDIVTWIEEQVRASREGTEAQRVAALASLESARTHVLGLRAAEAADHAAAVAGS